MKTLSILCAAVCAVAFPSCVDPYLAGELSPRSDGPFIAERQPVIVERRRYVDTGPPVSVERYSQSYGEPRSRSYVDPRNQSYGEPRPYYGDPVPSTTYQRRTTTRTYQSY